MRPKPHSNSSETKTLGRWRVKVQRVLRWGGIALGSLAGLFAALLGMSVPAARWAERPLDNPGRRTDRIVFRNASILTMSTDSVLTRHSLFVENGSVARIIPDSLADYSGFLVIDAAGSFVLPGLADMHAHIFDRSDLPHYLSYGVTRVRNPMGLPAHLRWKSQLANGELTGSRMTTATPTLNAGSDLDPFHKDLGGVADIPGLLAGYKSSGYDFVKVYSGLSGTQFAAVMDAARDLGMPVAGHPPTDVPIETFLSSGAISFEHVEEIYNNYLDRTPDDSLAQAIVRKIRDSRIAVTPTLSAYHHIRRVAEEGDEFVREYDKKPIGGALNFIGHRLLSGYREPSEDLHARIVRKDEYHKQLVRMLHEAGVPLLMGTDFGPNLTIAGETLHDEMQLWVDAGLPAFDVVAAATRVPGRVLGQEALAGRIEVSQVADFILVRENPLLRIGALRSPAGVFFDGRWFDEAALRELRELGEDKTAWYLTMGNLIHHLLVKSVGP